MEMSKEDYACIFKEAKQSTVYAHAMVWIEETVSDKKKTEREKFDEINKIVIEAIKQL